MNLAESAAFYERNPFWTYQPLCSLKRFHESQHRRRLVRTANQIGKTIAGAWEAWAHLTGRHRYKPDIKPSNGMILVADIAKGYAEISKKLWQTAPMDLLDSESRYIEGKGWTTNGVRMIRTKLGHTIVFRSGAGDPMASESITVGWVWIDEPPKAVHFGGALSRVAVAKGPVWMTFTPINRPVAYLRLHVEGDPKTGKPPQSEWEQHRPKLTQADCTTIMGRVIRDAASIKAQVADYTRSQINQRVNGEWEGLSDTRAFEAFNELKHETRKGAYPPGWVTGDNVTTSIGIGADHGEHVGNQVAILARWQIHGGTRRVWITGESVNTTITTEVEDAKALIEMLGRDGLLLREVDRLVGDINSGGKQSGGRSVNELLTVELNRQAGHKGQLVTMEKAKKGRIIDRIRIINLALMRGELYIDEACVSLLEAIRTWDNTDATCEYKHMADALAYLVVPLLEGEKTGPGRIRMSA